MRQAMCTAILTWVILHFSFIGVGEAVIKSGSSSKIIVVVSIVCGRFCMYFYLELHQEFWCLRPMD